MSFLVNHCILRELMRSFGSYYRQAKAYQALGDVQQAQETLRRALSRRALATDKTLLSLLNELDIQLD